MCRITKKIQYLQYSIKNQPLTTYIPRRQIHTSPNKVDVIDLGIILSSHSSKHDIITIVKLYFVFSTLAANGQVSLLRT